MTTVDYGVVHVLLGSATGLSATGSSLWSQDSAGHRRHPRDRRWLRRLAGDRQHRRQRLRRPDCRRAGRGHRRGRRMPALSRRSPASAGGPTGTGSQTFSQATAGIANTPEDDDEFGYALAVGDFGGDSFLDLAVGAPGESGIEPALRRRPSDPRKHLRPHRDRQPAVVAELGWRRGQRRGERPLRRRARRRQLSATRATGTSPSACRGRAPGP